MILNSEMATTKHTKKHEMTATWRKQHPPPQAECARVSNSLIFVCSGVFCFPFQDDRPPPILIPMHSTNLCSVAFPTFAGSVEMVAKE